MAPEAPVEPRTVEPRTVEPRAVEPRAGELGLQEARIVDATLVCIARWGTAKTTLDDVARQAGCSRATVYRLFPGGRDALFEAVANAELQRFFDGLAVRLAEADTLEDLVVAGLTEAGRRIRANEALRFLVAHEPGVIMPRLAFDRADVVLRRAGEFASPYLQRWLSPVDARRAAEFVTRLALSYSLCDAGAVDLTDEASVRDLVRSFVLPGLLPLVRS